MSASAANSLLRLVCGYAPPIREQKVLVLMAVPKLAEYEVYVDESGGHGGKKLLLLSACIATYREWANFSDDWYRVLHAPPRIEHFHTREARKKQGQFARWKAIDLDRKIIALTEVILNYDIHVLSCWISEQDYAETVRKSAVRDLHHAYFCCAATVLHKVSEYMELRGINTPPKFVFDDNGDVGLESLFWFPAIRDGAPERYRHLMANTPTFEDDEDVLPLQAADLIAWHKRRQKEFGRNDPETAASARINELAGGEVQIDRAVLELMAAKMERVPGIEEARSQPSIYKQLKQQTRKAMRRAKAGRATDVSPELRAFNDAMDAILHANPTAVKEAMEAEKAANAEKRKAKKPSASRRADTEKG